MKGRPPKPTHLKLVEGNRGKRPINSREPNPNRARLEAPPHLSRAVGAVWEQLVEILDGMAVLTEADAFGVEALAEAIVDFRAANRTIAKCAAHHAKAQQAIEDGVEGAVESDYSDDGHYYKTVGSNGSLMWRLHPAVNSKSRADGRIRSWSGAFGLSPADRVRIMASGPTSRKQTPASKFLT
jgi:P27 family predicted phage terminase small subunit